MVHELCFGKRSNRRKMYINQSRKINKPRTAQVGAPLKIQKRKLVNICLKQQKAILLNQKPNLALEKRKIKNKISNLWFLVKSRGASMKTAKTLVSEKLNSNEKFFRWICFDKNQYQRILNNLIVPKMLKRGPFEGFLTSILLQNIKKTEGGPFGDIKIFLKKVSQSRKNSRGHLVPSRFVCYVLNRKIEGGPFGIF